jgi:MFS family permease
MIFSVYYRYYSATIIQMTGVRDQSTAIWLAAVTAFVNFIFTLVGVWLVDKIGRRKLILSSTDEDLRLLTSYITTHRFKN